MRWLLLGVVGVAGCDECVDLGDYPGCRPIEECRNEYDTRWFAVQGPSGTDTFYCDESDQCAKAYDDAVDAACRSI